MANVTMSDYIGFIFSEITRARVIADGESRRIAELYAKDDILKNFSVPRFKIPEMNLSIPVIVSGAKFSSILNFIIKQDDFINFLTGKMKNAITSILIKKNNFILGPIKINPIILGTLDTRLNIPITRGEKKTGVKTPTKTRDTDQEKKTLIEFHELLLKNSDPSNPENIVKVKWGEYFYAKLESSKLTEDYNKFYPKNELFLQTCDEVLDWVFKNTVVTSTKIDNLLVDPETNVVKNNSTDATIFLINAKIMEEGIFIKSIKDTDTGKENKIVEFE
ncbi:MAG: hypothetical protein ACK5NK_16455 [Niabella sp.]